MRLEILSQHQFDQALKDGLFARATVVRLYNLPGLTALPDLPAAKDVWLYHLPGNLPKPKIGPRGALYRNGRVWR